MGLSNSFGAEHSRKSERYRADDALTLMKGKQVDAEGHRREIGRAHV